MTPVTNHTITVTIDGVNRTGFLLADTLFLRSSIGNGSDVAEFELRDPAGSYAPADWDEVKVYVNGTAVFGGYIVQRAADSIGAGAAKRATWQVTCKDWSVLLDQALVNYRYMEVNDNGVVYHLFDNFLNGDGFNASLHVANVRDDIDINFEEISMREALNELAGRCGANWHIDPEKYVWWYAPDDPPAAPFAISQTPNNTTTFAPLEGSLGRSVDASQITNRVRVIGSESASTTLQTDSWTANGTDAVFGPLTKKPHSMWLVQYTVHTGGQDVNVSAYASQIGLEPDDSLLVDGGEETVLVNLDNRTVKITDVGGLLPKAGTQVTVKYYYSTPIEVVVDDAASQTAFGRVFEASVYDEGLTSPAEATEYGEQLLARYAFGRETIHFDITRYGLMPGQAITVTSSTMGLSGDYLIQELSLTTVAVGQDAFMVVCRVQAGALVQTLIETLQGSYSAGAGRLPARRTPGRLSNVSTDLGDVVAGRAIFTDGGTARFEWGEPNGATGVVVGLEDIEGNAYGAQYIYDGGTVKAKLGRLTGLPDVAGVTPTGWGLYTTNGYFSGQIVASEVVGGTITAATLNGGNINDGTIAAAQINGGTVTGMYIDGGTISGISIVGQTIEGAQIVGGTITSVLLDSSYITNGTIDSMAGSIGGFTIQNNLLWSNGGTIATGSVVNSSNPGAYLTADGLFGYGTAGMTFGLWSDPAKKPWFSSGTINNVVYEVYESGVIRTGPNVFADGGVQIDNSGVFGVNPITGAASLLLENGDRLLLEDGINGVELYGIRFALDSTTGKLFADDAYITGEIHARTGKFTGTVDSAYIVGGTITGSKLIGAEIIGQIISGSDLVGGTITGIPIADAGITNVSLGTSLILGGTMTAAQVVGGTVTGGVFTGGTVSQGTISAALISGGTVSGALISGGTFSGGTTSGGTISAARINGGTVSGALISGGTFSGGTTSGGTISAARVNGGTVSGGIVSGGSINSAEYTNSTTGLSIGTSGISFANAAPGAGREIRWYDGTIIVGRISATYSGGATSYAEHIGLNNNHTGNNKVTYVYDGTFYNSYVQLTPYSWTFKAIADDSTYPTVTIGTAAVTTFCNVRPADSTYNNTLGDSTHGWRYLYLYDGTDEWRISINTGGTLIATKV